MAHGAPGVTSNQLHVCVCHHPVSLSKCAGAQGLRLLATGTVSVLGRGSASEPEAAGHPPSSGPSCPQEAWALGCAPLFLARAMMSAALLLITLVMYTGQLIRPAMVMARNTASASSWGTANPQVTGGREGTGSHHPTQGSP